MIHGSRTLIGWGIVLPKMLPSAFVVIFSNNKDKKISVLMHSQIMDFLIGRKHRHVLLIMLAR
jgi:hypothetical protein